MTLIELMVVLGIFGLISTILIAILSQSSALISQGAATMSLNQKARGAIERMAPYIATAIPGPTGPALESPAQKNDAATASELLTYQVLRFNTTEDFLDPAYDPSAPWISTAATMRYEFFFDTTNATSFVRSDGGAPIQLGRVLLRKVDGPGVVDPVPRVIAHNVQLFRCYAMTSNSVQVVINTVGKKKGPAGNIIDVYEEQNGLLSIPSGGYLN